jgi:hypothetical protein
MFSTESTELVLSIPIFRKGQDGKFRKLISNINVEDKVSISYDHGTSEKQLACVVYHLGPSKDYGHYITLLNYGGDWYKADDEHVTRVKDHCLDVTSAMPFLLVYTSSSMVPVTGEINHSIRSLASRFEYLPLINPRIGYSLFSNHFLFFFRQITHFCYKSWLVTTSIN